MTAGPLAHLRVVDLTDLRMALAGRLLGDLGADVLVVEPPGGAPERARPPVAEGVRAGEGGLAWLHRRANQRATRLDLDRRADRDTLAALLARADVLLESVPMARRDALGLTPGAVAARHPHLVHATVLDFGLTGPRADWRLEALPAFAASGGLYASGFPDRPPCWLPGHVAHDAAAAYAVGGVLAALLDRAGTGAGQHVEVSVQEAALSSLTPWSVPIPDYHRLYELLPPVQPRNADGNYFVLRAADGWVRVLPATPRHWRAFHALLGRPEALAGEVWEGLVHRILNADVIRMMANECLAGRTRAVLVTEGLRLGVPIAPMYTPDEFVASAQAAARGYFRRTGFPIVGDAPMAPAPFVFSRTPVSIRRPAPARPAADGDWLADAPRPAPDARPAARAPLAGMTVVSLGVVAVGPEVCWLLAELGADVVKIESRAKLDPLREVALDPDAPNRAFTFNDENRGARSVCLDLGTEEGRRLALRLCAAADVVVENNRGGVAAALGLDYADVARLRPDVVYLASQGHGRGGPLGEVQAFGPLNGSFAGSHWLWNHPDAPYPAGSSLNHPDHVASKLGLVAVLAALEHRRRTGEGQLVDLAQTEAAAFLLGEFYLEGPLTGSPAAPAGNRVPYAAPHGVFGCRGDDRWVAIAVVGDDAWERFRVCLGWADEPALRTLAGRLGSVERLEAMTETWTAERSAEAAAETLQAAGVSAMPVMHGVDLREDPHLAARGALVTVEHPEVGPAVHAGNPIRLSRSVVTPAGAAPCLGADTEAVLTRLLGLTTAEVARLVAEGVCR